MNECRNCSSATKNKFYCDRKCAATHRYRARTIARPEVNHTWRRSMTKEEFALYQRARRYGMTREELSQFLANHSGMCDICKASRATHIDHCHETNKVRGMLCNNCNAGLGMFGDNQDKLHSAIQYLQTSRDWALAEPRCL